MATGIEVLAIDQRRQCQGDAIAQLLLVSQANLAGIVHLGANAGFVVQLVFGANGELGVAGAAGPRQLNAHIQFVGCTLEDRSAEFLAIITAESKQGFNLILYKILQFNSFTYTAVCRTKSLVE